MRNKYFLFNPPTSQLDPFKHGKGSENDSFKYLNYYNGRDLVKTVCLKRETFIPVHTCFGGSISFPNKLTGVWFIYSTYLNTYDKHHNIVKTVCYTEDQYYRRDTSNERHDYKYDGDGRILNDEMYINDTLYHIYSYVYKPGYKRTEEYYSGRNLKEVKEEYFDKDQLQSETLYTAWDKSFHKDVYLYDEKNRKKEMNRYSGRDTINKIMTRKYYYR